MRVAELQVQSGREALRNVGQGVLLDAVTAYTNVLANQSLVTAQRANVAFLRETLGITQKRLNAGDVTPTDTAQAEARLSRGLADLNAAEVALAISQATYTQVIGNPPALLSPAETVDRYLPTDSAGRGWGWAMPASTSRPASWRTPIEAGSGSPAAARSSHAAPASVSRITRSGAPPITTRPPSMRRVAGSSAMDHPTGSPPAAVTARWRRRPPAAPPRSPRCSRAGR